jgi:hypothetical protein
MFKNPHDPENVIITQKVIEWTRAKFELDDNIEVLISEVGCSDANCPCVQTLIAIQTVPQQMLRIGKPLTFVRKWDVLQLSVTSN